MAELLVFMQDTQGKDAYHTAKLPKRGDVIVVKEDGEPWGIQELQSPLFQIVAYPGVAAKDFAAMLSREVSAEPGKGDFVSDMTNVLQYRGFSFAIDTVAPGQTGTRQTPKIAPPGKSDVAALEIRKAAIEDPKVIGPSRRVIG